MREKLEEFEEQLQALDTKQKVALYLGSLLFIVAAWFFLYFDDAQTDIVVQEQQIQQYKNKMNKIDFTAINKKIMMKKKAILNEKSEIAKLKSEIFHMQEKLRSERFLFVTEQGIATFVDRMLESSLKNHLLIKNIDIKDYNATYFGVLKGQKQIDVTAEGDFLNIARFLRNLEESVMLMGLSQVVVETNGSKPILHTNIKFYGIER